MAAALDLPESERAAYVARRCAERPEIRAEVESLLAADGSAGDFLRAQTGWGGMAACTGSLTSRHIGPYLLLDEIGRGGMGVVYRAGRDDGRFQKQVAVKIMTAAINSPEMLQRFRGEQQILATLEHPNIARLLDAGVSEDGLPHP
jgi:serine/threonine protein kinase